MGISSDFFFFFFYPPADGEKYSFSSPHFRVFSALIYAYKLVQAYET